MRIPQILDLETAIKIYHERIELSNADIRKLFGQMGSNKMSELKNIAREKMIQENAPIWNASYVRTECAYKAWGMDIKNLEYRYKKLKTMNLLSA